MTSPYQQPQQPYQQVPPQQPYAPQGYPPPQQPQGQPQQQPYGIPPQASYPPPQPAYAPQQPQQPQPYGQQPYPPQEQQWRQPPPPGQSRQEVWRQPPPPGQPPTDPNVPTFRPSPHHPVWPNEGDPGVEAFRPKKSLSIKLYIGWIPILIPQFAVWTLLAALVPQFAGAKPPIAFDFGAGALATVLSVAFLYKKFQKGALSTVLLISPAGIQTRDNLGFVNRIAWPDMAKVARVVAIASQGTVKGGGGKTFTQSALKDMGVLGWGTREVPPQYLERFRDQLARMPWDQASGKHWISIPISVIETDWVNGRIAQLIQQYRPDLAWDMHAEEAGIKTVK